MFVPLVHLPGHAQADFGEAIGIIGGVERKIHFFAFDLPHSDVCLVVGYPAETTEAFCDAHVRAFAFFGGVPKSILYDNTKIAVARILGDGKRATAKTPVVDNAAPRLGIPSLGLLWKLAVYAGCRCCDPRGSSASLLSSTVFCRT